MGPPESVYFTVVDGAMPHLFCLKEVEIFAVKEGVFYFFLKILQGSKKLRRRLPLLDELAKREYRA